MRIAGSAKIIVVCLVALMSPHASASAPTVAFEWLRQFGPAEDTFARGVAANALGDVFVSSVTGTDGFGRFKDVALAKYDSSGNLQWNIPAVTNTRDANLGIRADSLGNSYIASATFLGLDGPNAGQDDAFVRKYDPMGQVVWTRQIGTSAMDLALSAAANAQGDVFVTGHTLGDLVGTKHIGWDAFIAKYDALGNHQWTRQFGTDLDDYGLGLAADGQGNVFVVGITDGSLGGTNLTVGREDAYVRKYNSSGEVVWTTQLGTAEIDFAEQVAIDHAGNVFVTGTTEGRLGAEDFGGEDGFVARLSSNGNVQWLHQFGTNHDENAIGVTLDAAGRIYVSGQTRGAFEGVNQGIYDAFIAEFDPNGSPGARRQFGTTLSDSAWGITFDGAGSLYLAGASGGSLPSLPPTRIGGGFLAKIAVPEPATSVVLALLPLGHRSLSRLRVKSAFRTKGSAATNPT